MVVMEGEEASRDDGDDWQAGMRTTREACMPEVMLGKAPPWVMPVKYGEPELGWLSPLVAALLAIRELTLVPSTG